MRIACFCRCAYAAAGIQFLILTGGCATVAHNGFRANALCPDRANTESVCRYSVCHFRYRGARASQAQSGFIEFTPRSLALVWQHPGWRGIGVWVTGAPEPQQWPSAESGDLLNSPCIPDSCAIVNTGYAITDTQYSRKSTADAHFISERRQY